MKKIRGLVCFLLVLSLFGCAMVATNPALLSAIQTGYGALTYASAASAVHNEITRADQKATVNRNINQVLAASKKVLGDLDISIKEAQKNESGDAGWIKGEGKSSSREIDIQIAVAMLTKATTEIGVWAKRGSFFRDPALAEVIMKCIMEELQRPSAKKTRKSKK